MKAVVYEGPRNIKVKDVADAKIEKPTDVLVRITATNICGSDLHMYEGRTDMEPGRVLGHENMGEVAEVGSRGRSNQEGRHGVSSFQHWLRLLQELRGRSHCLLSHLLSRDGRRGLWIRRDGTFQWWAS